MRLKTQFIEFGMPVVISVISQPTQIASNVANRTNESVVFQVIQQAYIALLRLKANILLLYRRDESIKLHSL